MAAKGRKTTKTAAKPAKKPGKAKSRPAPARQKQKPTSANIPDKRPRGRPTLANPEIKLEICERLSEGEPLAQICRTEGLPKLTTVYDWMDRDEQFSERVARARMAGFDHIALDALNIANSPLEAYEVEEELCKIPDATIPIGYREELRVTKRSRKDALHHRRLQVETRLKLLACWDPKRYGQFQRNEVSGPNGEAIPVGITVRFRDA